LGANWPLFIGFFLAAIWRYIPMDDLTWLDAKWGWQARG
jgi:hypothetical protein